MAVLLIADVNAGELSVDATSKAVAAAGPLGDVTVLCVGANSKAAARGRGSGGANRLKTPGLRWEMGRHP